MRSRSALFDELFLNPSAIFEYRIGSINNEDLKDPAPLWIDGLSDPDAFCVGNCYVGTFEFTCKESAAVYNTGSKFQAYMRLNDKLNGVTSEWVLIGTYNIYEKSTNKGKQTVSYRAWDNMIKLEVDFDAEYTRYPIFYKGLAEHINAITDVTIDLTNMSSAGIIASPNHIKGMNTREVFTNMMITTGCNAKCTPDGVIRIYPLKTNGDTVDFTEEIINEYADNEAPITGVNITGVDGEVFSVGNDSGTVLNISCPWVGTIDIATYMLYFISGYVNKPIKLEKSLINPCVEANDIVRGTVKGGSWRVSNITYSGGASIRCDMSNGLWEQFRRVGTLSAQAERGGDSIGGEITGAGLIIVDHVPTPQETDPSDEDTVWGIIDPDEIDRIFGASAFDIAKRNGFTGTEQQWLDSLKGADGQNGRDGTNGSNGQDGREIEVSVYDNNLVWRYVGESSWRTIIGLDSIGGSGTGANGETPQFRMNGSTLQYRFAISFPTAWTDLYTFTSGGGSGGLPTGGTTGQILKKNSNNDFDASWGTINFVPNGGTTGQVLAKNSNNDGDFAWVNQTGGGGGGISNVSEIISADAGNNARIGSDGLLFVPKPNIIGTFNIINETISEITLSSTFQELASVSFEIEEQFEEVKVNPIMTSNTTPSPFVVSASSFYGAHDPWRGFDGNIITQNSWATASGQTGWLKIDMSVVTDVDAYTIYNRHSGNYNQNIRSWQFMGSNDNSNWDVLDTVADRTLLDPNAANDGVSTKRYLPQTAQYRYYMVNVTGGFPGAASGVVAIQEVELLKMVHIINAKNILLNLFAQVNIAISGNVEVSLNRNGVEYMTFIITMLQGYNVISIPNYFINIDEVGEQNVSVNVRSANASGSFEANKGYMNVLL